MARDADNLDLLWQIKSFPMVIDDDEARKSPARVWA
jgi:hypothetical protein